MKILILAGNDISLVNFRGAIIQHLVREKHEVVALAPDENGMAGEVARLGARFVPVRLARAGLNPMTDWKTRRQLRGIFVQEKGDVLLAYTIKPVVHGIPVAAEAGLPNRFALITGLGAAFHTRGLKGWILRTAATLLYRRAFRHCTRVIVQNDGILDYFLRHKIVSARSQVSLVSGSGVDVERFAASPVPRGAPVFLLIARMLWDKGIGEYVAAARVVRRQIPAARFLLVGAVDPNPAAISSEQLAGWSAEGVVEYRGAVADVRPVLAECSAYVLPSYHEGMPRSVLEAMAVGRPVITTDTSGCKETVIAAGPPDFEGVRTGDNGMLVPIRAVEPLAAAMCRLARDPHLGERMGERGRMIAVDRFDVHRINEQMVRVMNLTPAA